MAMDEIELDAAERKALAALARLARTWPKTLGLMSFAGTLCAVKLDAAGEWPRLGADNGETLDQSQIIETFDIKNDGGDWG